MQHLSLHVCKEFVQYSGMQSAGRCGSLVPTNRTPLAAAQFSRVSQSIPWGANWQRAPAVVRH